MFNKMRWQFFVAVGCIAVFMMFTIINTVEAGKENSPIKIGLITWESGPGLGAGRLHKRGFQTAISYINENGGILGGRKVVGLEAPQGATGETAKSSALKLVMKDGIKALFGPMYTIAAPSGLEVARKYNIPLGTLTGGTWVFKQQYPAAVVPCGTARGRAKVNMKWAAKNDIKKVVLVMCDIGFNRDIEKTVKEEWGKAGSPVEVLDIIWFTYGQVELKKELTKAVGYNPDLIWSEAWSINVTLSLMKTLKELGYKGKTMLDADITSAAIKDVPKEITEGFYVNTEWLPDPKVPANKAFCDYWVKKWGVLPETNEESIFSATVFILKSMDMAGTAGDGSKEELMKIGKAMHSLKYLSPHGEDYKLSKGGLVLWDKTCIAQIDDGKFVVRDYIETTPNDLLPWL